jgi:tetraacyldisaccharide 4'-kinase
MISPSTFRDLVSGRKRGPMATLLRCLLRVCETPYSWAMRIRNRRYDRGRAPSHMVDVPVISIGNLTLGGTGKTPMVEWVARYFRQRGVRVSIVSRGYGATAEGRNDEALELQLALPDVPHLQNADRVVAAQAAIEELETELILLDDSFQHRRLDRDLDIVLLDATEPFGFDHVFPRGTLREPLAGLARAEVVVLSRADMLSSDARQAIGQRVSQLAPQAVWCEVQHAPRELVNYRGERQPTDSVAGKRVAACCAIGNPAGFLHTLETLDADVIAWREFPDHHSFTREDVESLGPWAAGAEMILCTRKDLVKLQVAAIGGVPLWSVGVQLQFMAGQSDFEAALAGV